MIYTKPLSNSNFKNNHNNEKHNKEDNVSAENNFDFKKANWNKFRMFLDQVNLDVILKNNDVNVVNEFIINNILNAAKSSIPTRGNNNRNSPRLPKYLIDLIKLRRYYKKLLLKKDDIIFKQKFYEISKIIKEEKKELNNKQWEKFSKNCSANPLSSKKLWKRIKTVKDGNKVTDYPSLLYNNQVFSSDEQKANLFSDLLSETFKDSESDQFNNNFKDKIEEQMREFFKNQSKKTKKNR
jgi:hypothetical protein